MSYKKDENADPLRDLCIVVPVSAGERLWRDLLNDLMSLPEGSEIVLVGPEPISEEELRLAAERSVFQLQYLPAPAGRAVGMNRAAYATDKKFLWFLHADSKIPKPTLMALKNALTEAPDALHFFELRFLDDGPRLVGLNKLGANLRSQVFGLPFGHQGFALAREQFLRIGCFNEELSQGEDQVFVFEARRKRIPVRAIHAPIFTSARRYQMEGWSRATTQRLWHSTKQVVGEYVKLVKNVVIEKLQ